MGGGGGGGGTCPDTLRAVSKVQDGRPGVFGAFEGGLHQSDEARVLGLLQAARQPLLHHRNELVFAELAVLVLVEDGEDDGDDVVVEVDVGHRFGDVLQRGGVDR